LSVPSRDTFSFPHEDKRHWVLKACLNFWRAPSVSPTEQALGLHRFTSDRDYISKTVTSKQVKGEIRRRHIMDARYNWIIDNVAIRVGINVAVFALWLGAAVTALYM